MPNPLGEFEARLGKIVEGTFGAVFRSTVQPAELARAASKEMTRSRKLGLDKMYVSNVYFVFISPKDAKAMGDLTATIEGELETYLLAFARERDYSFVTRPIVRFTVDEGLKRQGKFDIVGQQMTAEAIFDELGDVPGVTDGMEPSHPRDHGRHGGHSDHDGHGSRASSRRQAPMDDPFDEDFIPSAALPDIAPDIFSDKPAADPWADAPAAAAPVPDVPVAPPMPDVPPTTPPVVQPVAPPAVPAVPPAPVAPLAASALSPTPANVPTAAVVTAPVVPMSAAAEPTIIYVGSIILPGQSEMQLDQNKTYIMGRQESCDLTISDANISRQHAELFWDGEGWSIRDLGSTNGTKVNGHRVQGEVELHDNDNIELGMSTATYHETSMMG